MEDIGEVIEVKDGVVRVQIERHSACKNCGLCIVCGDGKKMMIEIEKVSNISVGDKVRLSVPGGMVVLASFLVYIFPLIGFMSAICVAQHILPDKVTVVLIAGFVGLFVAFALSKWAEFYIQKKKRMEIKVDKV